MYNLFAKNKDVACSVPRRDLHIYENGKVSFCCYTWLPHYIGNINQTSILEILESQKAKNIQKSTTFGNFKHCNEDLCPALVTLKKQNRVIEPLSKQTHKLDFKHLTLFLNYDKSCNLTCSSCRNDLIYFNKKNMPEGLRNTHNAVLENIDDLLANKYELSLNITGSGDAFASELYSQLMNEVSNKESIKFCLQTNGILMNEQNVTPQIRKKILWLNVSVDAATNETYHKVRRGGKWSVLMNNIHWMNDEISRGGLDVLQGWQLNFIVQEENYHEIPMFLEWALSLSSKPQVWFNLINDWGHLPRKEFQQKAIWRAGHPQHQNFLNTLRQVPPVHSQVLYGNLLNYMSH